MADLNKFGENSLSVDIGSAGMWSPPTISNYVLEDSDALERSSNISVNCMGTSKDLLQEAHPNISETTEGLILVTSVLDSISTPVDLSTISLDYNSFKNGKWE